jgi:GNAT superfamily N-acetyltransferase
VCFENPIGAGKLAQELCFCAPPGRMGELINRYEEWARSNGCRAASLACEQRFPAFERLYRKYGYRTAELTTSKEF